MTEALERKLTQRISEYVADCIKDVYTPGFLVNMLNERGGLATLQHLFRAPTPSEGFIKLWEEGKLKLSMEALVLENKEFQGLFTDEELATARTWLKKYGYEPKE